MTDIQQMIMQQEGTGPTKGGVFFPYQDTQGFVTIGYGRCLDKKGLSATEALFLLNGDIADAVEDVQHCCSVYDQISRPRQLAMVSLAYNLGREGLAGFVHFLNYVHQGDWENATLELLDSKAAKQDPQRYRQLARMVRENVSEWV